jgi:hypothetical protein
MLANFWRPTREPTGSLLVRLVHLHHLAILEQFDLGNVVTLARAT